MDFQRLFETQKQFDEGLVEHNKEDRIKKKFLALLVEQSEAIQEEPAIFKYWSSNPKAASVKAAEKFASLYGLPVLPVEGDKTLEELVDMLHFILSLGNELELSHNPYFPFRLSEGDIVDLQMQFAKCVTDLYFLWRENHENLFHDERAISTYFFMIDFFLGIAYELGYTQEQLESAYYQKNQVNYERRKNGY